MAILMRATTPEAGLYRLASPSGGGQPRYCTLGRRCVFRKWTSLGSVLLKSDFIAVADCTPDPGELG